VGAGYIFLKNFGEAFGEDCKKTKSWTIGEYQIQEYKCIGWAGPYYNKFYFNKNGLKTGERGYQFDSCTIRFCPRNDLCLNFNICDNQLTELNPKKKLLRFSEIDSVLMFNNESDKTKKLTSAEIDDFVKRWNSASVFDFRDNEKPFYPKSSYLIKVFICGKIREFETGKSMIKDHENWTYNFLESNEKVGTKKFDEIWNSLKLLPIKNTVNLSDSFKYEDDRNK